MPRLRRIAPLIACILTFEAGAQGAETTAPSSGGLPYDLSKVRGIDALPRDERKARVCGALLESLEKE